MTLRVRCTTTFDITATGIKNRFYKSRLPFTDDTGRVIDNDRTWQIARNQQCNWETINQLISLRTLPENISNPIFDSKNNSWQFEFDVINPDSIAVDSNPVGLLLEDCNGVPMILGLNEQLNHAKSFKIDGIDANIQFEIIETK